MIVNTRFFIIGVLSNCMRDCVGGCGVRSHWCVGCSSHGGNMGPLAASEHKREASMGVVLPEQVTRGAPTLWRAGLEPELGIDRI